MTLCYLGLGSNLDSPERQLRLAIKHLKKLPHCMISQLSSLYYSRPWGVRSQPNYYNMVAAMHTSLPPEELLHHCRMLEDKHQRVRKKKWGARTLDIDLLLYGDRSIHTPTLTIPHPQILFRDFVLLPLLEISPSIQLPNGQLLSSSVQTCKKYVIAKWV